MNLLLLQYNKYFNRIIKKEDSISNYLLQATNYKWLLKCNFNPNDGVETTHIINFQDNWEPDYLLVVDEENNIVSRWFIIDATRTRSGQYNLNLKRDSIADNYDDVIQAPCFIEKGVITNPDDPAIFNSEGLAVNQIKTSETLLKDKTGVAWIIGFLANNINDTQVSAPSVSFPYISVNGIDNWDYARFRTENHYNVVDKQINVNVTFVNEDSSILTHTNVEYHVGLGNPITYNAQFTIYNGQVQKVNLGNREIIKNELMNYINSKTREFDETFYNNFQNYSETSLFDKLNGKYIYDTNTSTMYQISVTRSSLDESTLEVPGASNQESELNSIITSFQSGTIRYEYENNNSRNITVDIRSYTERIELHVVSISNLSYTYKASSNKLTDAPYRMFAIPYGRIKTSSSGGPLAMTENEALNIASATATQLGSNLYDIQLLPFCPLTNDIFEGGVKISGMTQDVDYSYLEKDGNVIHGIIFYCKYSRFTGDIELDIDCPTDILEKKIVNECDLYRLASPNFASQFDFNLAKNGSITNFNYDCTYKPYNAYVHLNPNFNGLYGSDFNDYRGLVFQGDFTIPTVTEQWKEYQINNKNYLNAFNRQTESLENIHSLNQISSAVSLVSGTVNNAIQGNLMAGRADPENAASFRTGTKIGAATSLASGAINIGIAEMVHREQMSNRLDQFNFSLQNIQARPDTLARGSTFDYNNKVFPVLEYYTCTDTEKQAMRDKIKYEGYTINRVGKIIDFLNPNIDYSYIRCQLIRLDNINGDSHIVSDISSELKTGKYFKGE